MIRINDSKWKATLKAAVVMTTLLLCSVATSFGQSVNLTAGPTTAAMPDGTVIPMWGYTCGAAITGATAGTTATCAPLSGPKSAAGTGSLGGIYVLNGGSAYSSATTATIDPPSNCTLNTTTCTQALASPVIVGGKIAGFNVTSHGSGYTAAPNVTITDPGVSPNPGGSGATAAAAPAWSPVVITVPWASGGSKLTINLTNNLSFGSGTGQGIPTSIVITGQVGGGLGSAPTKTTSPNHSNTQACPSWFIASAAPGQSCQDFLASPPGASALAAPPAQADRVQSMGAEVKAGAPGTATAATLIWGALRPGTYLLESGTHPSIQVPMGLIGMLVVTTPPAGTSAGTAYPQVTSTTAASQVAVPAVSYNAEVPLEFSEIDPVQNKAVDLAVRNPQFSATRVWSGLPVDPQGNPGCGNQGSGNLYQSCYPPAVNYTPFYFLINGQAFDKTNPARSLFASTSGTSTVSTIKGNLLVRLVNAGLRMHVPQIVGSQTAGFSGSGNALTVGGFTLIAEDGNPVPDLSTASASAITAPRVKTEVFMAAGKTYDVMVNVPASGSLPIYDRELSLSANSSVRDAGMLAYISTNGSQLPVVAGTGVYGAGAAHADTYASVAACAKGSASCVPLAITDPSKGVIANDVNVYGVELSTPPTSGTLMCNAVPGNPVAGICANGTFTYTPTASTTADWSSDTFNYCANGAAAGTSGLCTSVTLSLSMLIGNPTANNISYTSNMATYMRIPSPGVLSVDSDPNGLPLQVVLTSVTPVSGTSGTATINMDSQGGFTASVPSAGTYMFTYTAQNSQGRPSGTATVTLNFPTPSNLQVNVLDALAYNNCNGDSACISKLTPFADYRWIIEEDKTFYVDPNCTANSSILTTGCPSVVGPTGQSTIPTAGVQFHTSTMDFVAQGCTGPMSCEGGQTMLYNGSHVPAVCDLGNGACRPDPNNGQGLTEVEPGQVHLDPTKRYYISVLPGDAANPFPANAGNLVDPNTGLPIPSACVGVEGKAGDPSCGHTMSGASIAPSCNILLGTSTCSSTTAANFKPVNVLVLPTPLPTGKLSVLVFEDDYPLNGEQDGGGGAGGAIAPVEPGLGGFNIVLWDTYGGLGDATGQNSNDMFNQPLSNSLSGTIDPTSGLDACPISANALSSTGAVAGGPSGSTGGTITGNGAGPNPAVAMTGMIVTCPKYESDGHTLSPLAGQAVIANLMPEKFSVQAYPGADRIARGEEWIQTNTLDGQHPHDAFIEIGDPSYFQEYGPAGYHVMIGFANPAVINARHNDVCKGMGTPGAVGPCTNTITGNVNVERLSRIPDERLYPSESRDALTWTQCWVSLGDPDGEDFMFTKCDANGKFTFSNVPGGNWRLTIGDQWNDQIIDGLSTAANVGCTPNGVANNPGLGTTSTAAATACPGGQTLNMGNIGVQQWQSNLYTKVCVDDNKNGICDPGEIGIPLIYTMVHYRDGHNANALTTDFNGVANFNETFPLFNWYVVEADDTRYKTTGIHTVYDAGGPADGTTDCGGSANGARLCGNGSGPNSAYHNMTNTYETVPLPADLSVPGAVYCKTADCLAESASFAAGTAVPSTTSPASTSTGRIDPPWVWAEGWAGLTGHSNWLEVAKTPYAACPPACATVPTTGGSTSTTTQVAENGGIRGTVVYASTRPFDDASQMIQQPWEPNVPNVTINLYQEGFASDGVTPTLTMVDTTKTSSWDDWAQGFYPNSTATPGTGQTSAQKPYMSCPGQDVAANDIFYFTLFDQPNYLNYYESLHNGTEMPTIPYNSQFKCYDAMKINNQFQPAPYDGKYFFPSSLGVDPTNGKQLTTVGSTNGVAAKMAGTNCTICVANPDSTDPYRVGTPMLPPGKYVVEVIMPAGYEVYKEEDKNLLIGDNFIAPVTQQFGGLGADVFIMPDQASVASMYDESGSGYNGTNYQNSTTASGLTNEESGVPGFPGYTDATWPCVGEMRVVPDYLSLFPGAAETAPFAGATRPLCDRKEVTLTNQTSANARFFIFTSTHIAAKYTGVITDDFTSEFDPFSPQFGEKFSPPNMPVSTKDYLGNELSRVYSDHWGIYNGLTFSSWDVNPPNITGYSPAMMTQCMNDPGPIPDPNHPGQTMTDPLYNPAYSDFCYINPYMPGLTTYNDTPVVPTQGFVGAGYNNVDCSYPDATPAVGEVDGDGIGPWVSAPGHTLTITALGDQQVSNNSYSGPSASVAPFNQKTITRHYGFSGRCTALSSTCKAISQVTIGGVNAIITSWSDLAITVTVPGPTSTCTTASATCNPTPVPNCTLQQQPQYQTNGGTTPLPVGQSATAECGQLNIIAGNGQQSIDTVTVTVGGKTPTHVSANQTIQSAIDAAAPGDLLIVDPTCSTATSATTGGACQGTGVGTVSGKTQASHVEAVLMWKPVRLQGVGAPTSIIDANAFPAGRLLEPWRRHVNCLFGLTLSGVALGASPYDTNGVYNCPDGGWKYFGTDLTGGGGGTPNFLSPQVDRVPLEAVLGWDATLNGNLAEQLQEPSLMGAYEGAGITVLGKGVNTGGQPPFGLEGAFPAGSLLLQNVAAAADETGVEIPQSYDYCTTAATGGNTSTELVPNPYPSNFECNPSSIDGMTIRDSSQGGGGVYVHGWNHNLQIANNRINNNSGTLSGGITLGQGEFPDPITVSGTTTITANGKTVTVGEETSLDVLPSCQDSIVIGTHLPFCLDNNVNMHNNAITGNSSLGDELFSGTLAGGGGASFCTGSDYYKFNFNWVCGNVSSAEGGGITHLGFNYYGDIEHNTIALNESSNPTVPTNGGGIMIMGTPDTDPVCTGIPDADCPPGLSDGTGPGLVVNANLVQSNAADSGAGGGIRLQQVNGTDISSFPTGCILPNGTLGRCPTKNPVPAYTAWNSVTLTNNVIVNNVAGWDGAGISLQDSLNVSIINNTVSSNDTLASSGVLTQSIGTPVASAPAGTCVHAGPAGTTQASCPQPSGVSSTPNSSVLTTTFVGPATTITCPPGMTNCKSFSNPVLQNNVIWQNRAFYIGVGGRGTGVQNELNQQNLVTLFEAFTSTAAPNQTAFGQCDSSFPSTSYWDVGVRGDLTRGGHESGFKLTPTYSVLDDTGYGSTNLTSNPNIANQYCNGGRVPPTCSLADGCGGPSGFGTPPGIVDASAPNPVFSLTPNATVDEGNNWINVSWGPLALSDDSVIGGANRNYGGGTLFANYALNSPSPAIDYVPLNATNLPTATIPALALDFFGNPRPDPGNKTAFDVGAVEYSATVVTGTASVTPTILAFGNQLENTTSAALSVTVTNTGAVTLNGGTFTFGGGTPQPFAQGAGSTCTATLAVGASCTYSVTFDPTAATAYSRTLTVAYTNGSVTGSPVTLTGTGIAPGSLSFTSATNGTLATTVFGRVLTFTIPTSRAAVTSVVTITATGGPVQITGETVSSLSALFSITGTTCSSTVPLASGSTCTVSVHYATPATRPTNPNGGTLSVANDGTGTVFGASNLLLSAR